ncbi:MAG: uroporphyrinogen decarboxylase family protein [Candidatus Bathyarchaeia archaeon]
MLERALKAINLEYADSLPLMTVISEDLGEKVTGVKIRGLETPIERMKTLYRVLDVDMMYTLGVKFDVIWSGRKPKLGQGCFNSLKEDFPYTDAFHIAYKGLKLVRSEHASQLWVVERPFKTYEELLNYLKQYDPGDDEPRSVSEIAYEYREVYRTYQEILGDVTLVAGEFYLTLFTYLIIHIGWPLLVRLALKNPDVLDMLLAKYAMVAEKHVEAWSRTGIKVFVSHDDIAWKNGLFFPVEWYSEHVKPLWRQIWKPIKGKEIKLIFVSDGDYRHLMDDIIEAGADGFHIEWDPRLTHKNMEELAEKYGSSKILAISPSYETMTYGSVQDAVSEAEWISNLAKKYPAIFLAEIPGKPENIEAFYKTWTTRRKRI